VSSAIHSASATSRNAGLDWLRAGAILLVLMGHWFEHGQASDLLRRWLGWGGVPGVELFFVLSGFLIGGILMRLVEQEHFNSPGDLLHFWARRWLRTVPLYLFFLLAWLRMDWRGPFSPADYPQYFVFLQNFLAPTPQFFELSWSLAVEEWFYLLYPLALLGGAACGLRARHAVMVATVGFVIVPMLLRLLLIHPDQVTDLAAATRIPVIFRLDSLMYGVGVAIVMRRAPLLWSAIAKLFPIWALLFVLLQWLCITRIDMLLAHTATRTLLFSVFSILAALLIPGAVHATLPRGGIGRFMLLTSKLSYSIYLSHILVIVVLNSWIAQWAQRSAESMPWYYLYAAYGGATYAVAALTYHWIELPFLRWRDRAAWFSDRVASAGDIRK
jgi:peptidoglycan/LPS O-acetylase OafA/YrhL